MVDPEVIKTAATTISVIFLTEAFKKSGQIFGESLLKATGKAIAILRHQSPAIAQALETGDQQALKSADLRQLADDPVFAEVIAAAEVEDNASFQEKWQALKAGGTVNIIGKQITISQGGTNNTQTNTFSNF